MTTQVRSQRSMAYFIRLSFGMLLALALSLGMSNLAFAEDKGSDLSLITETPEEGFALAVKLSQKGVATTQPDAEVRKGLRGNYAEDTDSLIAVSGVIATHFQTIAQANDYWKD